MFRKLSLIFVGFFCTGLFAAHAASMPITQQSSPSSQEEINRDRFSFSIANPNTIEPKKFLFELRPGQSGEDSVYLKNSSDVPLKFELYGADGTKTAQGSFALETKDQQKDDVGKWINFNEKEVNLNPGEAKKVKFRIEIPNDAKEGTYKGGVAAEKTKKDAGNPNVTIAVRIGIGVDVSVTAKPQPVPKQYEEVTENPFFQGYFWASLGLFIVSAGALAWSYVQEKKPKKHRHK